MSVVEQVLYHLAENRGFNKARDYAYDDKFRSEPTEAVLMAIQMDLAYEYNPPPVVFRALRPVLRARIRRENNSAAILAKAGKESDGTLEYLVYRGDELVGLESEKEESEE
jgi:hypothetical protein